MEYLKNHEKDENFKKSADIIKFEQKLDTHNLAIARRKVEFKLNKSKTKRESVQTWSAWAGSFFKGSDSQQENLDSDQLTEQEMQEMVSSLVPALTRQESSFSRSSLEPELYKKFCAKFLLETFIINISDKSQNRVFQLKIKDTFIEHLKHASPYEIITYQVKTIEINGIDDSNLLCNASKLTKNNFIDFKYELFPLNSDFDSTVTFTSKEPLCLKSESPFER